MQSVHADLRAQGLIGVSDWVFDHGPTSQTALTITRGITRDLNNLDCADFVFIFADPKPTKADKSGSAIGLTVDQFNLGILFGAALGGKKKIFIVGSHKDSPLNQFKESFYAAAVRVLYYKNMETFHVNLSDLNDNIDMLWANGRGNENI
jgi:hypothetical protein